MRQQALPAAHARAPSAASSTACGTDSRPAMVRAHDRQQAVQRQRDQRRPARRSRSAARRSPAPPPAARSGRWPPAFRPAARNSRPAARVTKTPAAMPTTSRRGARQRHDRDMRAQQRERSCPARRAAGPAPGRSAANSGFELRQARRPAAAAPPAAQGSGSRKQSRAGAAARHASGARSRSAKWIAPSRAALRVDHRQALDVALDESRQGLAQAQSWRQRRSPSAVLAGAQALGHRLQAQQLAGPGRCGR